MADDKPGIARWPKIRLALLNITKSANRLGLGDDDFADKADEIALRLETTAKHLRDLAKERRSQ